MQPGRDKLVEMNILIQNNNPNSCIFLISFCIILAWYKVSPRSARLQKQSELAKILGSCNDERKSHEEPYYNFLSNHSGLVCALSRKIVRNHNRP